ncbi:zinc finger protein RFP-like isoform X2 [Egretta garzetta]|uniref:zinc finger protein RFP-like isoform X2 n=1 Tax=Egretta garzetta TaxID=188379 RepID=UPI00051F03E2|nr:zinc finger protein RFP-like isoform X2 [Egretta garzetta]
MAEHDPLESLRKEASCSICLDYFSDPVSINCGHSFCRACIMRCSGKSDRRFPCPQCRGIAQKKKFRPNRELRNLAEIAKKLSAKAGSVAGVGGLCLKHQEPLKLFCQEDRAAICVVCDRSHAHRAHSVAPIEEAAQECKEQIQNKLKSLKDERERLQGLKLTGEKRSQKYLQQTRAERWKTMLVFKQLQQFQDEQERLLLTWLEEVENQIVRTQMEDNRKISVEISHLGNLIRELEGMNPQPENKSLQDARNALTRCDARTLQQLTEKFPRVEKSLKDFSQKNIVLKEALRKFKESLPVELDVQWANVTLDPDTANPHLVLSEDRRSVRWDETPQDLPSNPQRFDTYCSVLGCEGFTVGRHYWEAQLGSRGFWAVGVARDSAWRKGWINLDPSQGIWAVGICGDRFQAFTSFEMVQPLNGRPRTLRVSLDYEKGRVAFFDADNETLAFAFPPASFNGEKILPFFWLWESRIQLAP